MESDDEFADFTSAFPSTGHEKKMDGMSAFHEIGGSVFEIPPLDFEDDDQFSPTNSMGYSINTSSSGGPLELTLPPPISDPLAVPNGDVPLDPLPNLPSLNGFTCPPLSDELIVPSSVGGTTEQVIATDTIEEVVTENNKNVTVTMETTGTTFANFASFESMETPVTMETTGSDFSGFIAATEDIPVTMATKNDIGFANFSSPPPESVTDDYFGSFKSPTVPEIDSTPLDDEDDNFGNFSSFSEAIPKTENPSNTATSTVKEMTPLQEPTEDDFGDFGSFTVAPPTAIVAPPTSIPAPKSTSLKISLDDALINCFPIGVIDDTTTSTVKHLKEYLVSVDNSNKMWTSIKDKADSTSFFYQWNQSFLQDRFFTAVNVDPMLVPANAKSGPPSAGEPLLTLDTLPGGAENLLEGFGFNTSIKSKAQTQDRGFGWTDEGATLLDLSLPTSPVAPQEQTSAVIFGEDLLGVDLTAIDITAPPPNSTNNVLEETPTSWMDSELLELEAETQHMAPPTSSTSSYDWLARLTSVSTSSSVNPQGDTSTDPLTGTTTNGFDLLTSGNLDNGELDIISSSVTTTTEYTGWSFESAPLVPDTVVMETTTISTTTTEYTGWSFESAPLVPDTVVMETTTISTSDMPTPLPPPSTHEQGIAHLQKSSLSNKAQNLLDRLPNLYYMTHDSMLYVT